MGEQVRIWKDKVVIYLRVLSQYSPEEMEENHKNSQVKIAGN
jgi:hypothetical protein